MPNSLESWTISKKIEEKITTHDDDEYYYSYMHVNNYCHPSIASFWSCVQMDSIFFHGVKSH
jgi:hypothetical protein